jgi:hypothetical protein
MLKVACGVRREQFALNNVHNFGEVHGVPYQQEANSVFDRYVDGQLVTRRYYGRQERPGWTLILPTMVMLKYTRLCRTRIPGYALQRKMARLFPDMKNLGGN